MNKQELIEKYEYELKLLRLQFGEIFKTKVYEELLDYLKQLDEPQKPVVPQFVADYIEESRLKGWDLLASMCFVLNAKNKKTTKWFYLGENKNIFALAWINGYEVEKEKRYFVRLKGVVDNLRLLRHNLPTNTWTIGSEEQCFNVSRAHTRKELEEAGFGEVFDSPLFEVEEVEA